MSEDHTIAGWQRTATKLGQRVAELEAERRELEAGNDELRGELGLGDGEMTYRQKANSYREELNERCLQVGKLQIERKELEEGLSEMVSWAREIAGDCADDEQREMEEDMMERMDALLSRIRIQENSNDNHARTLDKRSY